jgi:DHA1 family bicyclomycin/chloramphenicol resistance-like MFS transporter
MTIGMLPLVRLALGFGTGIATLFLAISYFYDFVPPFALFLGAFLLLFFAIGILFGNLNSLAMQDVGEIAGIASALIGAISTFLAISVTWLIGLFYDGTLLSLTLGFVTTGFVTSLIIYLTTIFQRQQEQI